MSPLRTMPDSACPAKKIWVLIIEKDPPSWVGIRLGCFAESSGAEKGAQLSDRRADVIDQSIQVSEKIKSRCVCNHSPRKRSVTDEVFELLQRIVLALTQVGTGIARSYSPFVEAPKMAQTTALAVV
jgi:hypothetical protein